jgi:hypothetical protein
VERDNRDLSKADVEVIWRARRIRVISAVRNFVALRFIPLHVEGHGTDGVVEEPFRDVVNLVGSRADLSTSQRIQVYDAALIALAGLPLGMDLPSPFGILDELDQIVAGSPEISEAVQQVWTMVDDREFWTAVARRVMRSDSA